MEIKHLKFSEVQETRDEILKEQGGVCAICKQIPGDGASLDHQHKLKSQDLYKDGAGLVRGVLCRNCNVMEGKIWNNTQRYNSARTVQDRINFLESLVEYYKKENYNILHPTEVPKFILMKSDFNKLQKFYKEYFTKEFPRRKFVQLSYSKQPTKKLQEVIDKWNVENENKIILKEV